MGNLDFDRGNGQNFDYSHGYFEILAMVMVKNF